MLRQNLDQAESPVEALQVLMARLNAPTLKSVLTDLGLPNEKGDDAAKLKARLLEALT